MARIQQSKQSEILEFERINIHVPRKFLRKCFYAEDVSLKDIAKTVRKKDEIEKAKNQIRHLEHIVDKILTVHVEDKTTYSPF